MKKPAKGDPRILTLVRARTLVEEYMRSLDVSTSTCKCCSVVKYNNWVEFNAHKEMHGVVRRLEKQIAHLQGED